jgi:glycosyltransferase involved in cell wall biosynthesis
VKLLLVAEEIPEQQDTGAFVYLRLFIDYCAERRIDMTLLVTGHRYRRLIFRPSKVFPALPAARIIGPDLFPIGPWCAVVGLRSWRHALFSWILRRGPRLLRGSALRMRSTIKGHTAFIGRWLGASEVERFAPALRSIAPDIMLVNTIFVAAILDIKPPRTRSAVITHDVLHQRTKAFQERGLSVEPPVSPTREAELLRRFDTIIAISAEDAAEFRHLAPETPTVIVPPPSRTLTRALNRRPDQWHCVFLGTGNALNVDGLSWFISAIWPAVKPSCPEARLELIGTVCSAVQADDPTLIRRFVLEDIAPALAGVSFAVNPLRAGSGLKIKMLDYFAYGLPAITTSVGAAGFPRHDAEPFVVCDDPGVFADTVVSWLRDPSLVARYAARCSAYVQQFSSAAAFAALDKALGATEDRAISKSPSGVDPAVRWSN